MEVFVPACFWEFAAKVSDGPSVMACTHKIEKLQSTWPAIEHIET